MQRLHKQHGFTLIELSIVLVIIGFVVGGVLVGQDLIRAGEVRATLAQVEKYNTAANTFRSKFGYLPGDINPTSAAQFGFAARGSVRGEGDGNGNLEGVNNSPTPAGILQGAGETIMFWVDLSSAVAGNLIEGGFNTASSTPPLASADITGTNLNLYLPQAKIGRGNYFYAYGGTYTPDGNTFYGLGVNYFGLSAVSGILSSSNNGRLASAATIPVIQAYAMDTKVDDGLPQSGNVLAWYLNVDQVWGDGTDATHTLNEPTPYTGGAYWPSSTHCYDNKGAAAAAMTYSTYNNGQGANCALSFKFQ